MPGVTREQSDQFMLKESWNVDENVYWITAYLARHFGIDGPH